MLSLVKLGSLHCSSLIKSEMSLRMTFDSYPSPTINCISRVEQSSGKLQVKFPRWVFPDKYSIKGIFITGPVEVKCIPKVSYFASLFVSLEL